LETRQKHLNITTKSLENRVIRFVGSDESVDRDGDEIMIDGWMIDSYLKNPVAFFGHESNRFPVGKSIAVTIDKRAKQLIFDIKFPTIEELSTNPATPSAHALDVDAIYNMAKLGVLNCVSVGFRGIDYTPTATGRKFTKQELMEISIVPIPANANAVAIMRSAGILETVLKGVMKMETKAGKKLSKESRDALKGCHGAMHKALEELKIFIGDDEPEEGDPEEKVGNPVVGQEIGDNVNEPQPKKEYVINLIEKNSTDK